MLGRVLLLVFYSIIQINDVMFMRNVSRFFNLMHLLNFDDFIEHEILLCYWMILCWNSAVHYSTKKTILRSCLTNPKYSSDYLSSFERDALPQLNSLTDIYVDIERP